MFALALTRRAPQLSSTTRALRRRDISMATAYKMHVTAEDTGLWKVRQTEEAASKTSELLQHDLETHHVFINAMGFHNHLAHHILALFGTGATPSHLQQGYHRNAAYQRPAVPAREPVVRELQADWALHAPAYLGRGRHYADFLAFFQREVDARGWRAVVAGRLLAAGGNNDGASDPSPPLLLPRLFAGLLHPLLQLQYGLEWAQPALVAEALAQACVHRPDHEALLLRAERDARAAPRMPRVAALLAEARRDPALARAARAGDDGVEVAGGLARAAPEELAALLARVRVGPDELEERTAEMFDAVLAVAASATFHADKVNKFDFFLIHHVNIAPIFLLFNAQSWIPVETKVRLLEWKIRYDLLQYVARGAPDLQLDKIKAYQPKEAGDFSISDTMSRVHNFSADDGHAIKLARAAVICEEASKKYEDRDWMMIKGDDMWMRIHNLIVDSVEAPGATFVRSTGFDEAWVDIPDRSKL